MIYIVAPGGGFKCPRKIHLNTLLGGADYAHHITTGPFRFLDSAASLSWIGLVLLSSILVVGLDLLSKDFL